MYASCTHHVRNVRNVRTMNEISEISEIGKIREIPLPDDWRVESIAAPVALPIHDLLRTIHNALDQPLGSLPLIDLAGPGTRVCIAVENTGADHRVALDALLTTLCSNGVLLTDVVVLAVAPGFDPLTLPVTQTVHDADDRRVLEDLGRYEGVPFTVNHHAVDADLLIGLGTLHLDDLLHDAASSRLIAHDLAGSATRNELADTRFLDDLISPWRNSESIYDRVVREGARRAGLVFAVEMLFDEHSRTIAVKAGMPRQVNTELRLIAHTLREAAASRAADLLVADVGPVGFYSAARAPIHIGMAPDAALVRGGIVILPDLQAESPAEASEAAEIDAFYDALDLGANSEEVIRHLSGRTLRPGEARAYLLAHVLQRHPVITVSAAGARPARHIIAVRDMFEAAELAETLLGRRPYTLLLSRALSALPVASRFAQPESAEDSLGSLLDDLDL